MAKAQDKPTEPRVYLFKGDDDYRKNAAVKDLLDQFTSPDFADFDLEHMEGNTATSDRIIAGVCVPPFGSKRRGVIVRYANKLDPAEQDKLAERMSSIPSTGCLVLVSPAPDKQDGKVRRGGDVGAALTKAVRKVGKVIELGNELAREKATMAREFAESAFTKAGKRADSRVIGLLLQRVGSDFSIIETEIKKLIDYTGDGKTVTTSDIEDVTTATPEEKIFSLVDAVAAMNQAQALHLLDDIFYAGADPDAEAPKTLAMLARQFRLIYQAKMLLEHKAQSAGKNDLPEEIRRALPSGTDFFSVVTRQPWMREKLLRQARALNPYHISRAFQAIAKCDLMLKGISGGVDDPRMAMELLVTELASPEDRVV